MEPLRAQCAKLLASAGAAPEPRRQREALGRRERRLLRGIASGLADTALAADLLLTPRRLRATSRARLRAHRCFRATSRLRRSRRRSSRPVETGRAEREEISRRAPPVERRERRALTLFVSDIANSSELIQRLGDEAAQALIQEHNRLTRTHLRRHQGVELQHTGDGFIASFEHASHALRCSVALQQDFDERCSAPPARRSGSASVSTSASRCSKKGASSASRCTPPRASAAPAEGGQVLASDEVWRAAGEIDIPAARPRSRAAARDLRAGSLHLLRPPTRVARM